MLGVACVVKNERRSSVKCEGKKKRRTKILATVRLPLPWGDVGNKALLGIKKTSMLLPSHSFLLHF